MRWPPFVYQGKTYDLSHLDSFEWEYTGLKKGEVYKVFVTFRHHCFTKELNPSNQELEYKDAPYADRRAFDFDRYALSRGLPEIVKNLMGRKCRHGRNGGYLTIERIDENGRTQEHDIIFYVTQRPEKPRLRLLIDTSFIREPERMGARSKNRPVNFESILYNVQVGKPVRMQEKSREN